jgi:hypothetical protein
VSAQPSTSPLFDYSTGQTFNDGGRTYEEMYAADKLTVKTRKRASAFAASFNAVMRRAGIVETCHELNRLEKLRAKDDPEYKPTRFDPNEIMRTYLVLTDAAQRTEWMAEQSGAPYPKIRRFKCSAAMMESFYKRTLIPSDTDEADRQRQFAARARAWRRRWAKVHSVQRHLHLAFFLHEKGAATDEKKEAGHFTDNLTDVLAHTARRAGEMTGEPVGRFNRAADEALAHFRASVAPYAPEWNAEDMDAGKATTQASGEAKKKEADKWRPIRNNLKQCVRAALQLVREDGLSESEAFARRQELHALIETEWADAPEPDSPPEKESERASAAAAVSPLSPVTNTADTTENRPAPRPVAPASEVDTWPASVLFLDRTNLSYLNSEKIANCTAKSQVSSDAGAEKTPLSVKLTDTCVTENLTPTEQAMLFAEAVESVSVSGCKAVYLSMYSLAGEAEMLGSEPQRKGDRMSAAAFKARVPEYVRRNREEHHNVAFRVWGAIIQIDDASAEVLGRLKPFAFSAIETSPGNFQVWLSLPKSYIGADGKINEAGKALRTRLLKKFEENGETANGGAYGSTRLPGTLNIKEKYQPSFPRIRLVHVALGRTCAPEELEAAGLLAASPIRPVAPTTEPLSYSNSKLPTGWPDYQYYVSRAPLKEDGQPNLSRADESFVIRCYSLGHSRHSIAAMLRSVRDKAARRDDYVERTLNAAESYLATQPQTARAGARQRMVI